MAVGIAINVDSTRDVAKGSETPWKVLGAAAPGGRGS
jgi:hypothetical protein